ncbi:MAG TPA: DUF393 domain-containing protein [Corynebacterium urealyticum]|uniref:DUF393 domain-containing protein n=1 Tax=Candidatus Corynebacterium intestinavium TaxID=2838531 RepID=A0A9D2UAQ6_9CORY|nr:DUF393 domain-containing protein [Candidatus Corynebacterium intestinavium]HJD90454.1 DUF393 domain-containing protein [Corynebacterium urealyticum]
MAFFFYDGRCAVCGRLAQTLTRLSPGLSCVAGSADDPSQPADVRANIAEHAVYLGDDGTLALGHRAIGEALWRHGRNFGVRLAGRALLICALSPIYTLGYRLFSRNRARIGRAMGLGACESGGCAVPRG